MTNIYGQIKKANKRGVPLVAVATPDPEATITGLCAAINGDGAKIQWDIVRGLTPRNDAGNKVKAALGEDTTVQNPNELLAKAEAMPAGSVVFVLNGHKFLADATYTQAIWNLRDKYRADNRMLVLLAPSWTLPPELSGDVLVFDEPLPTQEEIAGVLKEVHESAGVPVPADLSAAVEAATGVTAFQAEQIGALALTADGLELETLWERKRKLIEQTPGLKVAKGGERFADLGGVAVIKDFLSRVLHGRAKPNAVVFVDEIEKMLGGAKSDTSGVGQDQLGCLLAYMQDQGATGMIFVGPPGAAKSAVAKAAGNEVGIPTISLDLGAAKGSLVGQSEQQLRAALKVITAVSNGQSIWIATCNSISELPPELRRRFTLGTFFFDLPTAEERESIWAIYRKKYNLPVETIDDEGWTGAEIRQCADIAWRLDCPVSEAANFVVPVAKSAAEAIERLRTLADGRFLDASRPGVYRREVKETKAEARAPKRTISL